MVDVEEKLTSLNKLEFAQISQGVKVQAAREQTEKLVTQYNEAIEAISFKFAALSDEVAKIEAQ